MICEEVCKKSDVPKTPEASSNNVLNLVGETQVSLERHLPSKAQVLKIRKYLETENFRLDFQGIFDEDGKLEKGELLARMDGPNGVISPDSFNPIIESIGQKSAFDYLVVKKAFETIAQVKPLVPCSININPSTFEQGDSFLAYIDRMQTLYDVDPKMVILEILETEPVENGNYERFNGILFELRNNR